MALHVEPTRLVSTRTDEEQVGYRAWDGYLRTCGLLKRIPAYDLTFLKAVLRNGVADPTLRAMFEGLREREEGLWIGERTHPWQEVKDLVNEWMFDHIDLRMERLVPEDVRVAVLSLEAPDDWDEKGANAVTASVCQDTLRIMARAWVIMPDLPPPIVSPSTSGAVRLFWSNRQSSLALSILSSGQVEVQWYTLGWRWPRKIRRDPLMAIQDLLADWRME